MLSNRAGGVEEELFFYFGQYLLETYFRASLVILVILKGFLILREPVNFKKSWTRFRVVVDVVLILRCIMIPVLVHTESRTGLAIFDN